MTGLCHYVTGAKTVNVAADIDPNAFNKIQASLCACICKEVIKRGQGELTKDIAKDVVKTLYALFTKVPTSSTREPAWFTVIGTVCYFKFGVIMDFFATVIMDFFVFFVFLLCVA